MGKPVLLFFFLKRDDLYRNVACDRIQFKLVEYRPTEHVRQEDIE